jgi:hypothetical protein
MRALQRIREAALNNARWCELVCRAHGLAPRTEGGLWLSGGPPPRYYPHAVTLEPSAQAAIASHRPPVFKDSYADVDGVALGYQPIFRASWLWGDRVAGVPTEVHRVSDEAALEAWERRWEPAEHARQFPASLLEAPEVAFLLDETHGAGCIANASEDVVGLSNAFGFEESPGAWVRFGAAAAQCFPGRALVGYERGAALKAALDAGFAACGELVVWVQQSGA